MVWDPKPARDADGHVIPHDDPATVPNEMTLLRHVHPLQWVEDKNRGGWRATSAAFNYSIVGSKSMSFDAWEPMKAAGLEKTHHAGRAGKGVVEITTSAARELGFMVGPEPVDGNIHHVGVWRPASGWSNNFDKDQRRELSRAQRFVSLYDDSAGRAPS